MDDFSQDQHPLLLSPMIRSDSMLTKEPGSTWVTTYEGKVWPVVICDNATPPEAFMNSRPVGDVSPAILLGKLIYIWVVNHRLREFELEKDYIQGQPFETEDITEADSNRDRTEKTRRNAFRIDAVLFETPSYWKGKIEERSEARKRERETVRIRKQALIDDDDNLEVLEPSSASSSKRRRLEKGRSLLQFKHPLTPDSITKDKSRPKFKYPRTPISTTKKKKSKARTRHQQDSDNESSDDLFVRDKSQSGPFTSPPNDESERERNRRFIQQNPPPADICVIFVGPRHKPFLVPKNKGGVSECDFLGDRVVFTEEHGSHINLDEHVNIDQRDFIPIAEFLKEGEFAPRLIDALGFERLEGVVLPEEKSKVAEKIAKVYLSASEMQFAELQMLCVRKLKILNTLAPSTMLVVLLLVMRAAPHGCKAEEEVREWLADYIAKKFWMLVEYEGPTLARLMSEHGDVWRSVLERFAQNPSLGSED